MKTSPSLPGFDEPFIVTQERSVDCAFGVAHQHVIDALHAVRPRGVIGFSAQPDVSEGGRPYDEIRIRWADGSRFFGAVETVIRFRVQGPATRLIISASSRAAFENSALERALVPGTMRASLRDMLDRIAVYAERREQSRAKRRVAA